jgi:hypothetical protein
MVLTVIYAVVVSKLSYAPTSQWCSQSEGVSFHQNLKTCIGFISVNKQAKISFQDLGSVRCCIPAPSKYVKLLKN